MSTIFQFLQKRLGMSVSDATFSIQANKTNVLILGMFMSSSIKVANHLEPNFKSNSKIYKNTKIRGDGKFVQHLLKSW